jgi:long-chain fatty acid transport protein
VNINPSIAYRINEHWSIGAGFSAQYVEAELSNAIDFGTLDAAGAFYPTLGLVPGSLGLIPQRSDGHATLEGDSWGFGFNLGVIHEFNQNSRIGVSYRSRIKHTLEGDVDFKNVPAGLRPYPIFRDTDAEADVTLPDTVSVSFFHQINPQWKVMADITWTNWRLFDDLIVEYDNSNQPNTTTTENWQDSYRYSVGVTYIPDKTWTVRLGTAYDTSAVASAKYRTPRIPDGDRFWTTLGAGYKISDKFSFDVGYAHLFINEPDINKGLTGEDAIRGGLRGTYDAHIDILSAQLNLTF